MSERNGAAPKRPRSTRVLVIEDQSLDFVLFQEYASLVEAHDFDLSHSTTLQEGLDAVAKGGWDVIVTDLNLPDSEGLDTVRSLHARAPDIPLVVLSGLNDRAMTVDVLREGAQDYLVKNFLDAHSLQKTIDQAMERKSIEAELARSQEALRRTQKLEVIGRLAGGVAHDFNNLLAVISGYAELCLEDAAAAGLPDLADELGKIVVACDRAGELTHQLLALGRRQDLGLIAVDVNDFASGNDSLLQRAVGPEYDLVTVLDTGDDWVLANSHSLQQVLLNLVLNARDAMPVGGKICVRVHREDGPVDLGPDYEAHGEEWVVISVQDEGVGIAAAELSKVTEPFFSTKTHGEHSGLGLSIVSGIATRLGGGLRLESEVGKGTRVSVYVPRTARPAHMAPPELNADVRGGTETLLVVEDEGHIRTMLERYLGGLGYRVIVARDGEQALSLTTAAGAPDIDLVLSDVLMPNMDGPTMAEHLRAIWPDLPVLFMSGYSDERIRPVDRALAQTVSKPFTMATVGRMIRRSLDARLSVQEEAMSAPGR